MISEVAAAKDRPSRALLLEGLLQLPRIANAQGQVEESTATFELGAFADCLPPNPEWQVGGIAGPRELEFRNVLEEEAIDVCGRFHYLHSPRIDSRSYGLYAANDQLVALAVSSALDMPNLRELLRKRSLSGDARVISRVFAFAGAPPNTLSFLLSRVRQSERTIGIAQLLTYVNPNMGFSGVSYRASGWALLGEESGTMYRYLDGRYVTERELRRRFNRGGDSDYARLLGERLQTNCMPLLPLQIYHTELR